MVQKLWICSSDEGLTEQLQYKLSAFFLKMQTICHPQEQTTDQYAQWFLSVFIKILKNISALLLTHLWDRPGRVIFCMNMLPLNDHCEQLKGENFFYKDTFPFVKPLEYLTESSQLPLCMCPFSHLCSCLKNRWTDILEQVQETSQLPGHYLLYCGSYISRKYDSLRWGLEIINKSLCWWFLNCKPSRNIKK